MSRVTRSWRAWRDENGRGGRGVRGCDLAPVLSAAMEQPALRRDAQAVLLPWIVTRIVVLAALGTTTFLSDRHKLAATVPRPSLFEWDASFYRYIARHGYASVASRAGLRFFPLYPLLTRALGDRAIVLRVLPSVLTLAFLVVLRALVREWADDRAADRTVWLAALIPGALATVMGYAEPLYLLLATVCLLALTRTSAVALAVAGVAGALAALTRPIGVVLVVAFAVVAWQRRDWRTAVAGVGPPLGLLTFLLWSAHAGYGFTKPLRLQSEQNLRGETVDPVRALYSASKDVIAHHRVGPAMHVAFALAALVLCVVALRRLPLGPALYGVAAVLAALTSRNLDSFERYLLAAFPIVAAAGTLRSTREVDRSVLALLAAALTVTSLLAFTASAIP